MNVLNNNTNTYLNVIAIASAFLLPFAFGSFLVVNGQITLGALFAITQLSNSFVNPILQILNERNNLSTTKGIVNKIKQFIAKGEQKQQNGVATDDFKQLEIKDLTLKRQGKELASQINFAVAKGQKVAVIGPSGSGKSTMLQYLMYGDYGQAQEELLNQKAVKPGTFTNLFAYSS